MLRTINNTSIYLHQQMTRLPQKIIVPVFCACMIAARGLAAISGDLVRRLIFRKMFSDATTEPIAACAEV